VDGEISWVTVFCPNDISELRMPKNTKYGTKVVSSMRMMHTLTFLEKVNCGKICKKKLPKISQKHADSKKCGFLFHSHGGAIYMQKQSICGTTM